MSDKKINQPYLIITAGNTGSGKTALITETMKYLGISKQPYTKILVDDLVENDIEYKIEVQKIINKVYKLCREEGKFCVDPKCIKCKEDYYYNHPSDELYEDFKKAYFKIRKQKNCNKINPGWDCDELNNKKLTCAVLQKQNIIFEYTGQYISNWLLNTNILGQYYNIIFSCSIVNILNLHERNVTRAFNSMTEFKKDNIKPAPRLPNVTMPELQKNVNQFRKTINELYEDCILKHLEKCGDRKIDKLLIFDNNGKKIKIIFDSTKNEKNEFSKIDSSFDNLSKN
jgi:hypothetical protein